MTVVQFLESIWTLGNSKKDGTDVAIVVLQSTSTLQKVMMLIIVINFRDHSALEIVNLPLAFQWRLCPAKSNLANIQQQHHALFRL